MRTDASTVPVPGTLLRRPVPATAPHWRTRIGSRGLSIIGSLALVGVVVLSLGLVLASAARASFLSPPSHAAFPHWMAGPLGGVWSGLSSHHTTLEWDFSLMVAAMYLFYLLALLCAPQLRVRWVVAAVVLVHAVFFLAPPLPLTDAFNYINYGRMGFVHHLNPYVTIPALEPHSDPAFIFSNWHHLLSPYGPLFTLLTYALAPLGVATGFWILKLVLVAASLGGLLLVWRCAELLGRPPLPAFIFVGLNPLVLVWGLGGDHNDFLMLLCILLGFYLLLRAGHRESPIATAAAQTTNGRVSAPARRGRRRGLRAHPLGARWRGLAGIHLGAEAGAGAALMAAVAIKASAGILLPVIFCGASRRLRLLAGAAAGAVALGAATLLAFGAHLPDLGEQSSLVTSIGLPNLLGYALGLGGESSGLRTVLSALLAVTLLLCCVWAWRSREWLPACGVAMLALLLTLSWELPWYVYWLLPLAALARSRALRGAALVLGLYLILAWIPLTTDLIHGLNFRPNATPLGEQHSRVTKRLLH